jgi:hypothetical protein
MLFKKGENMALNSTTSTNQTCENPINHIIKHGDNLYALSKHYKTTVRSILSLNTKLDPYNLKIGSTIKICPGEEYTAGSGNINAGGGASNGNGSNSSNGNSTLTPVSPIKPIPPIGGLTPVTPILPITPVNPSVPTNPTFPLNPVNPGLPTQPSFPNYPGNNKPAVDPVTPTLPILPSNPLQPAPVYPTYPNQPAPTNPVTPTYPINPKPITPTVPTFPENLIPGWQTVTPINPPTSPVTPTYPINPKPITPTVPTFPSNPGTVYPTMPVNPNCPVCEVDQRAIDLSTNLHVAFNGLVSNLHNLISVWFNNASGKNSSTEIELASNKLLGIPAKIASILENYFGTDFTDSLTVLLNEELSDLIALIPSIIAGKNITSSVQEIYNDAVLIADLFVSKSNAIFKQGEIVELLYKLLESIINQILYRANKNYDAEYKALEISETEMKTIADYLVNGISQYLTLDINE